MRIRLLCEDRRHESLVADFCEALGYQIVKRDIAPKARGAASGWVLANYAGAVRTLRALAHQRELGLIAVVDGDNVGVARRLASLDDELRSDGKSRRPRPREPAEKIAVFVPTWSVETWLLWLAGHEEVVESRSFREDPRVRGCVRPGRALAEFVRTERPGLASLEAARVEGGRLG
jgi:hypothetical protein